MKPGTKKPAPEKSKKKKPGTSWKKILWVFLLIFLICSLAFVIWEHRKPRHVKPPPKSIPPETLAWEKTHEEKDLVFGGIPKSVKPECNTIVLRNIGYVSGYSDQLKNPLWVSYRVDSAPNAKAGKRPSKFTTDSRTSARVKNNAYAKTGYDRGHLAPNFAIASRFGAKAQEETFFMTNIVPQKPKLNRDLWESLERIEIDYSNLYSKIWVMTGPVFDSNHEFMPSRVEIPDAFFKIILDEDEEKKTLRFLPFLVPQDVSGREPIHLFLTSVDNIEEKTGFDFFWALNDPNEDYLEAQEPHGIW